MLTLLTICSKIRYIDLEYTVFNKVDMLIIYDSKGVFTLSDREYKYEGNAFFGL